MKRKLSKYSVGDRIYCYVRANTMMPSPRYLAYGTISKDRNSADRDEIIIEDINCLSGDVHRAYRKEAKMFVKLHEIIRRV